MAQESASIYAGELLRSLMFVSGLLKSLLFACGLLRNLIVSLLTVQDMIVCWWTTWDSHCFLVNFSGVYLFAEGLLRRTKYYFLNVCLGL
jgi:hypothetical protein